MAFIDDAHHRLEAPRAGADLARGFAAEVADPAWMLGRQWQLGEHRGEDASSPVRVTYRTRLTPIDPLAAQPGDDPRTTPAEAIVESEPGDFWTVGRRVAAGRQVAAAAQTAGRPLPADGTLLLARLPGPYARLDGTGPDGRSLWIRRVELDLDAAWFGALRPPEPEPADVWDPAELSYSTTFTAGGAAGLDLTLDRHDGGDLDWWSVDAVGTLPATRPSAVAPPVTVHPGRFRYPGAPLARWWQIEDGAVDLGGYAPDRSHLATILLLDLVMNQSDDWFTFPVDARAGHVVTLADVVVHDSFGEAWTVSPPVDWSLFAVDGLDRRSLVLWATAATPLAGPVLDEVAVGIDEDANVVWAVEQRLRGRALATEPDPPPIPPDRSDAGGRTGFTYLPTTRVRRGWHPYPVEEVAGRRRFVQGRVADLSGAVAVLAPPPESDLLADPLAGPGDPVHQIEPAAVPADGLRLERRPLLARRTDGTPVLWTQRRRHPLLTPPASPLRFDTLTPTPA